MNRCYLLEHLSEEKIWFIPFEGESYEVCGIEEINIIDGQFIYDSQCYPLDERFETELEILNRWNELFPNGKLEKVVSVQPIITEDEKYKDMVDQLMASYLATF